MSKPSAQQVSKKLHTYYDPTSKYHLVLASLLLYQICLLILSPHSSCFHLVLIIPIVDIQFAYNLERCIYYLCGEDPSTVRDVMASVDRQFAYELGATGAQLDMKTLASIQEVFGAVAVSDDDTKATMRLFQQEHDFTLCPVCVFYTALLLSSSSIVLCCFCLFYYLFVVHSSQHSAIAVHAARTTFSSLISMDAPLVCVLTAHPAKFEETVRLAIGKDPLFPPTITALRSKPQRYTWLRQQSISSDHAAITNTTATTMEGTIDDNNDKGNVPLWRQQWIDTIKTKIQDISSSHRQQQQQQQQQPLSLVGVHQTDFHPGTGNALQACVATLLGRSLDSVPNFITLSCGYDKGIEEFASPHFHVCKIMLADLINRNDDNNNQSSASSSLVIPINQLVILRGKSPRGILINVPSTLQCFCFPSGVDPRSSSLPQYHSLIPSSLLYSLLSPLLIFICHIRHPRTRGDCPIHR